LRSAPARSSSARSCRSSATAKLDILDLSSSSAVVSLENRRRVRNHIGGVRCAGTRASDDGLEPAARTQPERKPVSSCAHEPFRIGISIRHPRRVVPEELSELRAVPRKPADTPRLPFD
jgi:hypothetical protein